MVICDLRINERAVITEICGDEKFVKRFKALGVKVGDKIKIVRFAPFNDPMEIEVNGFLLALRRENAKKIKVERL